MKYLTILIALFVLFGCQNEKKNNNPDKRLQDKEVPDNFEIGEAKNGVYTNGFFNISFKYNEDWDILSYEELEALMELGAEVSSGKSEKLKKAADAASVRTAQHFAAFKYDRETFSGNFNPSIIVLSENIKAAGLKYGDEYLEQLRELWSEADMNIKQIGVIEEEKINGRTFFTLTGLIKNFGVEVTQKYHCAIIKNFAFVIIDTYMEEADHEETAVIMESFKFEKS